MIVYNFFFKEESPYRVSILRIFIALFMLLNLKTIKYDFFIVKQGTALNFSPVGLFNILSSPLAHSTIDKIYFVWLVITVVAGVGLLSRISVPIWFGLSTFVLGYANNFGKVSHSSHMMILVLLILSLSKCGDALSVDSFFKKEKVKAHWQYRWPISFIQTFVILSLFTLGLQKVFTQGFQWVFSDGLLLAIFTQPTRTPLGEWLLNQPVWVSMIFAGYTLYAVELLSPLAFIKPFRYIYPILWASLHVGILFMFGGFKMFFSQIVIYTCFYNIPKIFNRYMEPIALRFKKL